MRSPSACWVSQGQLWWPLHFCVPFSRLSSHRNPLESRTQSEFCILSILIFNCGIPLSLQAFAELVCHWKQTSRRIKTVAALHRCDEALLKIKCESDTANYLVVFLPEIWRSYFQRLGASLWGKVGSFLWSWLLIFFHSLGYFCTTAFQLFNYTIWSVAWIQVKQDLVFVLFRELQKYTVCIY